MKSKQYNRPFYSNLASRTVLLESLKDLNFKLCIKPKVKEIWMASVLRSRYADISPLSNCTMAGFWNYCLKTSAPILTLAAAILHQFEKF